jgi:monoamine oxidase
MIDDPAGVQRYPGNPMDAPAYRFVHGAASLTDALSRELPEGVVMLDHPVVDISESLVVTTEKETWQGNHVVVAVPPALAVEKMQFPKNLPSHLIDVARDTPVWMGETVKVVAMYSEPFWRDSGLAGAAISRVGPLHEIHDLSGPGASPAALFGFARTGSVAPNEFEIRNQLARIFGERAASPQELLIKDWGSDVWTNPHDVPGLGSPNYGLFGHEVYQHSYLDGRLHWCSTETAPHYAGHIEGALEAAERTLKNISRTPS